jgi:hypothetical protein
MNQGSGIPGHFARAYSTNCFSPALSGTSRIAAPTLAYSLIQGGGSGIYNHNSNLTDGGGVGNGDPRFVHAAYADLRLLLGSAACDTGANEGAQASCPPRPCAPSAHAPSRKTRFQEDTLPGRLPKEAFQKMRLPQYLDNPPHSPYNFPIL